jgi:hypothetical protein
VFKREEIAAACRTWGKMLRVPADIDGAKLLWALSGCESSFGENCKPRHEPYYHELAAKGTNAQLNALTAKFACAAHSSFGPWQELLVNCTAKMDPEGFASLPRCACEVTMFINARILDHEHAQTVRQIAEAYNSGKWQWLTVPPGVERYADDCQHYYDAEAMPA